MFGKVYVDDELVEDSNYTSHEGSTVIVFFENYLSTLALGTHNLKVVYNNGGVATGTFTIKEKSEEPSTPPPIPDDSTNNNSSEIVNPPTGDRIMEYVTLLLLSISGLSMVVVYKKREN